jgi:hypothetical protein
MTTRGMKTCSWRVWWVAIAALSVATVTAQTAARPQMEPRFAADELLIALTENSAQPGAGRTLEDLYTAAGVTEERVFPTYVAGTRMALLRLNPGTTFGRAFQVIQSFDFGPAARWSLQYLQPNYIYCLIPEGCPGLEVNRVFNFSVRASVGTGSSVAIGGMVIPGDVPRLVVFKVRGPSLEQFGVAGALANPRLQLFQQEQPLLENDDWGGLAEWEKSLANSVCPPPVDARESMLVTFVDPGVYTAVIRGAEGGTGVALLEMYLVDDFRVR